MRKLGPYRLRRRDGLRLRPRHGPLGFAEVAGWLAEDLVWVDGWFTSSSHREVELSFRTEEGWREVVAARFPHSRLDLLEIPGAVGQILVFPALGLNGDPAFLESLSVRLDGIWFRWAHDPMAIRPDLVARFPEKLGTLPEALEPSFRAFLREIMDSSVEPEDPIFARHDVVLERLYPGAWIPEEETPADEQEGLAGELEVEFEAQDEESASEELSVEAAPGAEALEPDFEPEAVENPPPAETELLETVAVPGEFIEAGPAETEAAESQTVELEAAGEISVELIEPSVEGGPELDLEPQERSEPTALIDPVAAVQAPEIEAAENVVPVVVEPDGELETEEESVEDEVSVATLEPEPPSFGAEETADPEPPEEPERSFFHGGEELPLGICIDDYLMVGDEMAVVHGWVFDLEDQMTQLEWLVAEDEPLRVLPGAFRYERFAVVEMYQPYFGRSAWGKHAFLAVLRGKAAAGPEGFFHLSTRDGDEIEVARPEPIYDPIRARARLWELCKEHLGRRDLLETVLAPSLEALQDFCPVRVGISDLFSLGSARAEPQISIVLPVEGNLALVEHQLAHLAHEPAMSRTELILVLAESSLTAAVERWFHHLSALYGLPFRLLVTDHESSWARAASLGAAQARGHRLVSLRADVFPAAVGWLDALDRGYTDCGPATGILGPKLLYHDQTIQHAGFTFGKAADFSGSWREIPSYRGLHRAYPGANKARRVPALSAACWMVDRELFEILGGFRDRYFGSDTEAIDLCLRCSEGGYESRYLPEVEMFRLPGVLDSPAPEIAASEVADLEMKRRFDRWLLTRTWNDRIERLIEPRESAEPSVAMVSRGGHA